MMDWTDTHCRVFHRLLAPHARLYTEMVHANAVIHGDRSRLLALDPAEHPVALQLGGSEPALLAQAGDGLHDLPSEDVDATGALSNQPWRRLIALQRTLYRSDDMGSGLALGQLQPLALPFQSYRLAFTPGLLALYQRDGLNLLTNPAAMLGDEGGYAAGDALKLAGLMPRQ